MASILIFGLGYTASRLAARLTEDGWVVKATRRAADDEAFAFSDEDAVRTALAGATHVLSSVPPDANGIDPVLARYGALLDERRGWIGYLSSTGVYGNTQGAWVDEGAPIGIGRRSARADADNAWQALHAHVFRLPGIYGPGRSALERVAEGRAHRIDLAEQVFSRIHVDDIVDAVVAAFAAAAGPYNIADDHPCSQNAVIEEACRLLRVPPPPLQEIESAGLSQMARGFYAENRRITNGKAKRLLEWSPRFADYRAGLADCLARSATSSPSIESSPPAAA